MTGDLLPPSIHGTFRHRMCSHSAHQNTQQPRLGWLRNGSLEYITGVTCRAIQLRETKATLLCKKLVSSGSHFRCETCLKAASSSLDLALWRSVLILGRASFGHLSGWRTQQAYVQCRGRTRAWQKQYRSPSTGYSYVADKVYGRDARVVLISRYACTLVRTNMHGAMPHSARRENWRQRLPSFLLWRFIQSTIIRWNQQL